MKSMMTFTTLWFLVFFVSSCNKIIIAKKPLAEDVEVSQDPPAITVGNITTTEEAGSASFAVTLDHAYANPVNVNYALTPHNMSPIENYVVSAHAGVLTFAPGETAKTIPILFRNNLLPENSRTMDVALSNATGGAISNANATMTITDSDTNFFGADVATINQISGPTHAPVYNFTTNNTLIVDSAGGAGSYSTIQAAVNDATPGTEILVNTGVYPETVTFSAKGNAADLPIVLKANAGHTPVLTGAEEISSSSVSNANTDGEESGPYATGFEGTTLTDAGFTLDVAGTNTAVIQTDAANSYMGNKSLLINFTGVTNAKGSVYRTFAALANYGSGGNEYSGRVMLKLSSNFAISGTATAGVTIMRAEMSGTAASICAVFLYPTANPEEFTASLLVGGVLQPGSTIVTRGTWNSVELYYKKSTNTTSADGLARLKINGTAVSTVTTHNSSYTHDRFRLGSAYTTACPSTSSWGCPSGTMTFDSFRFEESSNIPAVDDKVAHTIYENGMESGLSDFTSSIDSSNTVAASTAQAWDGSQSAKLTYGGTSAQNSLRRSFTATSDVYARVAFKLNSAFSLAEEADKVTSPSGTDEFVRELDLLTLYDSTGPSGRIKISLLKRGSRFFILGKVLTAYDESQASLVWTNDTNIADYLLIYKGHLGEIQKNLWNTIEVRFAGGRAVEGGFEIWLNGVSIAANINHTTNKYDGVSTKGLVVNSVQLGTFVDKNTGGASRQTMQSVAPVNGSEIYFDGLKITAGAPAGLTATGVTPIIYKYTYAALGAGESLPSSLIIDNKVLTSVPALSVVGPGSFYVNSTTRVVYFRMPNDATYTTQKVYSGRRNSVLKITDSANIVIQNMNIQSGNNEETGGIHIINSTGIKAVGNTIKGCNGPAVRVQDVWNAASRSSDILVSGNTLVDNGKVFGGGVRLDHMGHIIIENNLFSSASGNGIDADCTYDISPSDQNETTTYCTEITIARNIFLKSVESAIYLTSNTNHSRIYSNIITGARESGYGTQTTNGAWRSSGGSGVHIARGGHDNFVYNNLIYNIDRAGIALRAAAINNTVFNNTIAETGAYIVAGGAAMDFQRDYNEVHPAHNDPTKNNVSYNNIFSYTYGVSPCVDIDGYYAGGTQTLSSIANGPDLDNMSNNNIFYGCARAGKFNTLSYTSLPSLVTATGASWTARESNSQVFSGTLFTDAINLDYSMMTGAAFTSVPYNIKPFMP